MKNRINKNLLLSIYIILNILFINVGSCLVKNTVIDMKYFSCGLRNLLIVNSLIIIALLIYTRIHKMKIRKWCDLFLVLMIIFSIISTIFAIDRNLALYGITGRHEGLFSILYYFSIFFLSTFIDSKYKKYIIYSILFFGFIQVIYALLQIYKVKSIFGIEVIRDYDMYKVWADGFISNPNFFGSYMLICLSYSIGFYMDSDKEMIHLIYQFLIIVFLIGLLISNTLSCFIGLFVVLLFLLVHSIKTKNYLKYMIVLILFLLTTTTISNMGKTTLIKDLHKMFFETKEIAKGHVEDSYGTKRMYIWKETLKIVPKNIVHGVGIDNFVRAFNDRILIHKYTKDGVVKYRVYDKVHNEYLQILITEGIFALISYLLFYGYIVFTGLKNSFTTKKVLLLLPIIGYLVQAFFNISVIEVAPIFFISLGLCIDRGIVWKK